MNAATLSRESHPDFCQKGVAPKSPVKIRRSGLGKHVIAAWLPRNNSFIEIVQNKWKPATVTPTNGVPGFNKRGRYIDCTTDAHEVGIRPITFPSGSDYSFAWLASKNTAGNSAGMFAGNGTNQNYMWMANSLSRVRHVRGGTGVDLDYAGLDNSDHVWRAMTSANTAMALYVGGSNNWPADTDTLTAADFTMDVITSGFSSSTFDFDGKFQALFAFDIALSSSQVRSLFNDPYQIVEPAEPQLVGIAAAAPPVGDTLTAESGSYTYLGTATSLLADRLLSAEAGSYTYSGTDADLLAGFNLNAEPGVYTYSGTDAGLKAGVTINAESGAYAYTGISVDFLKDSILSADSGVYAYNGANASLIFSGDPILLDGLAVDGTMSNNPFAVRGRMYNSASAVNGEMSNDPQAVDGEMSNEAQAVRGRMSNQVTAV